MLAVLFLQNHRFDESMTRCCQKLLLFNFSTCLPSGSARPDSHQEFRVKCCLTLGQEVAHALPFSTASETKYVIQVRLLFLHLHARRTISFRLRGLLLFGLLDSKLGCRLIRWHG